MSRSRGKRYDDEPKLNMKKVVAFIIAVIVIIMSIVSLVKVLTQGDSEPRFVGTNEYLTVYTNEKWGVMNSKGEIIIPANYDEMIIIPDKTKPVFICTNDVDYSNDKYKTKVLNEKNEEILKKYSQVEAIDNYNSKGEIWYDSNVLKYKENDKYGLVNLSDKKVTEAIYDDIYSLKGLERSIIVEKDGKKGLINSFTGETIIEPIYTEIKALGDTYDNGYIVKNEKENEGIISANKKVILEPKYQEVLNVFGNNMYTVIADENEQIVNNKGETVLTGYGKAISIDADNIIVKNNDLYGIIDSKNTPLVECKYSDMKHVFGNYYIAKQDEKYGIIDINQKNVVDFKYKSISYVKAADIIKAEKENYETDIIDRNFNLKLTGIVSELNTEKGYIKIRTAGEYKYYNFNFEEKSNKDLLTNNTLFLVKNNGKYGYQNKAGQLVVDYIYDDATEQNRYGFCSVKKDGLWGALKNDGSIVVNPSVNLSNSLYIDFIGEWHLFEDLGLNVYTK